MSSVGIEREAALDVDDLVRAPPGKTDGAAARGHARARAIAERRRRRHDRLDAGAELAERALDDRLLGAELRAELDVLPRAAAAAADDRTGRLDARRAGRDDAHELRTHEVALGRDHARQHAIARRATGDEDDAAVAVASDRLAAKRQRVEHQLEIPVRRRHAR